MTKYCHNCGTENNDNSNFCIGCGEKLDKCDKFCTNSDKISEKNKKSPMKIKTHVILIISLIAILVVVCGTLFITFGSYSTEVGGITFNIPNGFELTDTYHTSGAYDTDYAEMFLKVFSKKGSDFESNYISITIYRGLDSLYMYGKSIHERRGGKAEYAVVGNYSGFKVKTYMYGKPSEGFIFEKEGAIVEILVPNKFCNNIEKIIN